MHSRAYSKADDVVGRSISAELEERVVWWFQVPLVSLGAILVDVGAGGLAVSGVEVPVEKLKSDSNQKSYKFHENNFLVGRLAAGHWCMCTSKPWQGTRSRTKALPQPTWR